MNGKIEKKWEYTSFSCCFAKRFFVTGTIEQNVENSNSIFLCFFFHFSFLVCGWEWGRRSSRELETQLFIFPFINLTCWLFFVVEEIGKLNFTVQRPPVSVNLLINCAIRYLQFSFILWVIFWISSNDDVPHSRDRHRYLYAARFMTLCVMFMFEVNEYVWSESIWWRWRKKKNFS